MQPPSPSHFETFFSPLKEIWYLLAVTPHSQTPLPHNPKQPLFHFVCLFMLSIRDILCKCHYVIFCDWLLPQSIMASIKKKKWTVMFLLTITTVVKVHPCCSTYLHFISFYCWIIVHSTHIPYFIYPSI